MGTYSPMLDLRLRWVYGSPVIRGTIIVLLGPGRGSGLPPTGHLDHDRDQEA